MQWTDADVVRVTEQLDALIQRLPGVVSEESFGHVGYLWDRQRIAWLFIDHHGDGRLALCVKAPPGELEALVAADPERYFRPNYVAGWVGVSLYGVEPDWDEAAALLEQAWRMRADRRTVAAHDAARQDADDQSRHDADQPSRRDADG